MFVIVRQSPFPQVRCPAGPRWIGAYTGVLQLDLQLGSGGRLRHFAEVGPRRTHRAAPFGASWAPVLAVTALASAGAGTIHGAVAPEHTNWWASVVFFAGLAAFQIGWAAYVIVRNPGRLALLFGAGANLAAFATWTVSRTSGLPFGPHQNVAEPAARADIIASVLGVLVALGSIGIARNWRPHSLLPVRPAFAAGAGGLAVSALSLVALTGVSGHAHSIGEEHVHDDHASNIEAAAVSEPLTPAAALALCRRTAEVSSDAALAKALSAANGNPAAITKAEKAAERKLDRALAKCQGSPAPATPKKQTMVTTPHPDDGHSH